MKWIKENIVPLALIAGGFVVWAVLYQRMPEVVPKHWNAKGVADAHGPRLWASLLVPVLALGTNLILRVLPALSPKGFRMDAFQRPYRVTVTVLTAFLVYVGVLMNLAQAGIVVHFERALGIGVGFLFMVMGNYLGKTTRNFFFGIRTPWTLASETVWFRTHRFGGKVFFGAGALLVVSGIVGAPMVPAILTAALIASVPPVVYSFLLYRRVEGFRG